MSERSGFICVLSNDMERRTYIQTSRITKVKPGFSSSFGGYSYLEINTTDGDVLFAGPDGCAVNEEVRHCMRILRVPEDEARSILREKGIATVSEEDVFAAIEMAKTSPEPVVLVPGLGEKQNRQEE